MNIQSYIAQVTAIMDDLRVKEADGKFAAHYTNAQTPKFLLAAATENKMRQFDGDYMNDPEEGRYLVDVMIAAAQECTHQHKSNFVERFAKLRDSRLLYSAYRKATFLSCWTITPIRNGAEDSSDSLNHWRFYGDDGKGSCIVVPLKNLIHIFPDQLFKVIYGTESRGGGRGAGERPIRKLKDALIARLNSLRGTLHLAMEDLEAVIQATHPLLFLFKSSEYSSEEEVRSIGHASNYSTREGVLFDDRSPRRAYIEGNPGVICNGSILYYGPKADPKHAIEVMGLAANLGVDIDVYVSSMPYR
ncbi:DUF2971 domain-containing protein [Pseudomonas sp. SbB1]|uniref:DUF2971 domain-containing protein n=1 Tax=Pseudomonas putida (strain GB-1) TaxID=76869 RepID=B0KIZ3_PSEPG|nr:MULTISPECIES: DUF2971 domain-containing protein [Pseudomonas]ABZ00683.1 hypothetical protein PputGB1_4796 [Pseudomonas putida GB-1]ANI32596.1 hypothetical protein AA098_03385 [Pseudomonas sp. JY-Q]MBP0711620.1 DUF2971 domain-containing protein [Pseudomonas sp. T34]MCK2191077.1 DUF2971 domain-containing protein [Pseudomonas sp. MB04B]MDD2088480.1 DUF2971 domain-containing protein [Pseudomonas putida]